MYINLSTIKDLNKKYEAFGLVIQSAIDLPELPVSNGKPHVTISFGLVPEKILSPSFESESILFSPTEMLLKTKDAKFYVTNGNKIIIHQEDSAIQARIKLFIMGTVMGTLLHQRGFLPLHGSAIVCSKGGIIITGDSGAGKSTTAWALSKEGYNIITDDICAIKLVDEKPMLIPAYPQLRLWENVAFEIEASRKNEMMVEPGKYFISAEDIFHMKPTNISFIFVLRKHDGTNLTISKVTGLEKFKHIRENTYRPFMVKGNTVMQNHFNIASQLGSSTDIYIIERPESIKTINAVKELIIKTINN